MIVIQNLFTGKNKIKTSPFWFAIAIAVLLFTSIQPAQAQSSVTFAQFVERNGTQDFVFTNNGGSSATFQTVTNGSPVSFFFFPNISGLPAELQGPQNATLVMTSNITQAASLNGGVINQPMDQVTTITIFRDTPASVGSGSRRNLLSISFSPNLDVPQLTGTNGGNSATFSATTSPLSPNQNVVFTSDFLRFDMTTQRNLAFSFSSVLPSLAIGNGGFLQSFTAAGSGTFASDTPPVFNPPPTAATATVSGRVTTANNSAIGRVRVTMTDAYGISISTMTNFSGYFRFNDVTVGQNYFFSASSRSYQFSEPVRNLYITDNYDGLNFTATR